MRRLTATVVGVLCMLAVPADSGAADSNTQRWLVLTRPGTPTEVVATGALNARGTVEDFLTLNPDGTFDNFAIQHFPDGDLFYHGMGNFTITVNPENCLGQGVFAKTDTGCSFIPARIYGVAHAEGTLNLP